MLQVLLLWKPNSIEDNQCKLYDEDQMATAVSLRINMKIGHDSLVIKSSDKSQLHQINFGDIDAVISGFHEFNRQILSKKGMRGSNCLSVINSSHMFHLEFNNQSQRNSWFKHIHANILRTGKHWIGHHKNHNSDISTVIQYSSQPQREQSENKRMEYTQITDINDIILTPKRLERVGILLSGAYFRTPKKLSIRDIFSIGSTKYEFKEEIFVILTKDSSKSERYTHLKWSKHRNSTVSDDELMNVGYIGYISSISVNALNNKESNDEQDPNVFFMKIRWNDRTKLETLVLHHSDLNFLWYFARALIYCTEAHGITNAQAQIALTPSNNQQNKKINVFCGTYNVCAATPSPIHNLESWLKPEICNDVIPDLYVITLQEIIELKSISKNLLSDHTDILWETEIYKLLSKHYVKIESLVRAGLVLFVFAKKTIVTEIRNVAFGGFNVGTMGAPNKAGIAIRMHIRKQNICFIAAHLPSGIEYTTLRNDSFSRIFNNLKFEGNHKIQKINIHNHDIIFFCGDLNYRLNIDKSHIIAVYDLIKKKEIKKLLKYDQLNASKRRNKSFQGFMEAEINFLPSYKYEPGTNKFEMRSKQKLRVPSYTDRILYKTSKPNIDIKNIVYDMDNRLRLSDHKPVFGLFQVTISDEKESVSDSETYPIDVKRNLEKVNFLQKNYQLHLLQGIKELQCDDSDEAHKNNDIIKNIEKSHSELVSNMESLLKCLKTNYGE